jgi:hypothetical protein
VIVVIFGIPTSILIDLLIRKDNGIFIVLKSVAHGLAGLAIAALLFGDEGYVLSYFGLLNAILYYFSCVVLFLGIKRVRKIKLSPKS